MNGAKAPEPSPELQEKTVTPETLPVVIGTDEGYDGLSQVTVNPDADLKSENIKYGSTVFGVEGSYGRQFVGGSIDVGNVTGNTTDKTFTFDVDFSEYPRQLTFNYPADIPQGMLLDPTTVKCNRPDFLIPARVPEHVVWMGVSGKAPWHMFNAQRGHKPDRFPYVITPSKEFRQMNDEINGTGMGNYFTLTYAEEVVNAPDNLTAENIRAGVNIAGITGTYEPQPPEPVLESVVSIPSSFPVTIRPSEGYDGIRSVTVNSPDYLTAENIKAGVTIAGIEGTYDNTTPTEEKTSKATSFPVILEPQSGYALSKATVTAPDNLTAENIKAGVTIAGVTGSYDNPTPTEEKTVQATAFPVVVEPQDGYAISRATITAPEGLVPENIRKDAVVAGVTGTYAPVLNEDDRVVTSLPMTILPNPGSYGISKVELRKPVDLKPENIRAGATIIGVTGTYDNSTPTEEGTVKPEAFPKEVVPTEGHAFSKVTVEAPDNLSAENIRKDVTIAGVTGTYSGTGGWNEFLYSTGTTTEPLILSEETIRIGADHKCLVRTAMDPYAVGQTTSNTCSPLIRGVYQLAFTGPVDYSDNNGLFAGCTLMGGSLGNMSALTNVSFPRNMFRFTYLRGRVYLEAGPSGTLTLDSYCFTNMKGENRDKSIIDLSTANSLHVAANQTIQYATIVLPANVTFASDYTFNVSTYGRIRMTGRTPPTLPGAYLTIASDGQIMVPKGCLSAYRSATNWAKYASFMVEASE